MTGDSGGNVDLGIDGFGPATEIGRGGFGTVYRAEQVAMGRQVAVKVLPGIESDERRRFEDECRATGLLSEHPNIVSVHGAGVTSSGRPWLAMQLCASSLADRLRAGGAMEWPVAVSTAVKLAGALETAHRAGIMHRDIKPANVLLDSHDEPALADFGIARARGASETTSSSITGTIEHTAPEVLSGAKAHPGSDVYSLSSMLFSLVTGSPPFRKGGDEGLAPLMMRVVTEDPPDLRLEGLPDQVAAVLERGLAKDPAVRFANAADFGAALQEAEAALGFPVTPMTVHGEPLAWHPTMVDPASDEAEGVTRARVRPVAVPVVEPEPEPVGRRTPRRLVVGVGIAVVALLLGLLFMATRGDDGKELAASTFGATAPTSVTLDLGVVRARATGLDVQRLWTLAGPKGAEFTSQVTVTNPSDAAVAVHDEVVPKELAASVLDIDFQPVFTEVVQPDPIVRYAVNLEPGQSFAFAYAITVDGDGVSEGRLKRWQRALVIAQNAYDQVAADTPQDVIDEGGVVPAAPTELASGRTTGATAGTTGTTGGSGASATQAPATQAPTTQAPTTQPPPQNQAPTAYNNHGGNGVPSIGFGANESGTKCWEPLVINPLNNDIDPEGQPMTALWVRAYDSNGDGLARGGGISKIFNSQGNPHICMTATY
ncbi:MAG: serine/threonine-protein kinase, partial [Acidimicrobiales bacterium]